LVDVLLISPPFIGLAREPLGLYYLAGVLERNRISTKIFDFMVEKPSQRRFIDYLTKIKPKIVGVTSYTFNFSAARNILKQIKRTDQDIITVLGGVHASSLPLEIMTETPHIDYLVYGEGEETFLELCNMILRGEDPKDIAGLVFRDGEIEINRQRPLIDDLDSLPFPDRTLLPLEEYPVSVVQTSRGCPYNCIFCKINRHYGNSIRFRDPLRVVDECSILVNRYKRNQIFFFGDSFTFNRDWIHSFCDEIQRRNLKFKWGCETRVDNVSYSMLKEMKKAGCIDVQYGIDYGDETVLRKLGKNTSISQIEDAVRWTKKLKIFVQSFFIFNCPGENEETMENTYNLIQKIPIDGVEINLLTPYPGTILWDNLDKLRMKIINQDFDYYTTKKYVVENMDFQQKKFVPNFKKILKRLNLKPIPGFIPEIFNFLKKDIELKTWN
jgi:anaerobic magnesium-protoporphyrin IX monomethyl ester cyclase